MGWLAAENSSADSVPRRGRLSMPDRRLSGLYQLYGLSPDGLMDFLPYGIESKPNRADER